jgi:hypothetical protein
MFSVIAVVKIQEVTAPRELWSVAGLGQDGEHSMEVTEHGIVEIIPVKVAHGS